MTQWQRAWRWVTKPSKRRNKAWPRRQNHRANRRVGKTLDSLYQRLDKYQVN